ncbi:MAG: TorF family putative porin [Moraxellaceae bacterium]
MKLSKLSSALLAGGLLMSAVSAQAADEAAGPVTTTGYVAMTTDYLYRGITQSDSAALQGNILVSHESGVYFNVWGSSIAFDSGLELDPSIGFTGTAGDVTYDVGVLYYGYPNSSAITAPVKDDFTEVYGSVAFAGAKFGLAYAPDFYAETGKSIYLNASYGMEVGAGFTASAYLGYSLLDDEYYTEDKYMDYKVAVSRGFIGLTGELAYIGTDLDDSDASVVFTVTKAF